MLKRSKGVCVPLSPIEIKLSMSSRGRGGPQSSQGPHSKPPRTRPQRKEGEADHGGKNRSRIGATRTRGGLEHESWELKRQEGEIRRLRSLWSDLQKEQVSLYENSELRNRWSDNLALLQDEDREFYQMERISYLEVISELQGKVDSQTNDSASSRELSVMREENLRIENDLMASRGVIDQLEKQLETLAFGRDTLRVDCETQKHECERLKSQHGKDVTKMKDLEAVLQGKDNALSAAREAQVRAEMECVSSRSRCEELEEKLSLQLRYMTKRLSLGPGIEEGMKGIFLHVEENPEPLKDVTNEI